ncbi:unnamed protein product [Clonostachys chloroleuca]|uniref:Uncharacterized protein n=1 Tax=Clonostachys chloroleuca TaxID=1926264 RepID=A0AA35Q0D3_9HYPO|nr:unnamed protein product [Clonostachys chloroleuca]
MDTFDDPAAQDRLDYLEARKAFRDPKAHPRPCPSMLMSFTIGQIHLDRVRCEMRSLELLFDRILLATHPFIVFQAENTEWHLLWTPETDPVYGTVARSFIRRLQTWVATPPWQRTEVVSAAEIVTLSTHWKHFKVFEGKVKKVLKREEQRALARSEWFGSPGVKRVLMRRIRGRRSRLRKCVSIDEV